MAEPTRSQLSPYLAISHSCMYVPWVSTSWQGGPGSCCATACSYPSQVSLAKVPRHPPASVTADLFHLHNLSSNHSLQLFPGSRLSKTTFQEPIFSAHLFPTPKPLVFLILIVKCRSTMWDQSSWWWFCLTSPGGFRPAASALPGCVSCSRQVAGLCLRVQQFSFSDSRVCTQDLLHVSIHTVSCFHL